MTAVAKLSTTDLVRFLINRIDDDDTEVKTLHRKLSRGGSTVVDHDGVRSLARLTAECRAKRDVIAAAQRLLVLRDQPSEKPVRDAATQMLLALAAPYHDHPSFRADWTL